MKKCLSIIIIIMIMIIIQMEVLSYSTDEYQIEIPEDLFNDYTNSIKIDIIENVTDFTYTEEFLNTILQNLENEYKNDIKIELNSESNEKFTEEQKDAILNAVKYNEFIKKEVSTFTKNNYPCLHYISDVSIGNDNYYTETYQVLSEDKIFSISIYSKDRTFFEKEEVKKVIDSFTINNYVDMQEYTKEYLRKSKVKKHINIILKILIVVNIVAFLIIFIIRNQKIKNKQ